MTTEYRGHIAGTVTDSRTGQPIPGVRVGAAVTAYRQAVTDDQGRYLICDFRPRDITIAFFPPSERILLPAIESRTVTVRAGETSIADLVYDSAQYPEPPLTTMVGGFSGLFRWGFEESMFVPDPACEYAGARVTKPPFIWVQFDSSVEVLLPGRFYLVRWLASLTGPGRYGHMGASAYLMRVAKVFEAQQVDKWPTHIPLPELSAQ